MAHDLQSKSSALYFRRAKGLPQRKEGAAIAFAILRFEKHKGSAAGALEAHHERKKKRYASNPDIDLTRSSQNYHIITPRERYNDEIDIRIYLARCRTRKDSIRMVDTLITASPEFFEDKTAEQVRSFFEAAVQFMREEVGEQNIFSAVVHLDEASPHMHLCFTPITSDNRLSAKEILGNKKRLCLWQDNFYQYMAARFPGLQRGQPAAVTGRRHIPTQLFKQSAYLGNQMEQIRSLLEDMKFTNITDRRQQVLGLLEQWFPQAEDFHNRVQQCEKSLQGLRRENGQLAAAIHGHEEQEMEVFLLKKEVAKQKAFLSKLPPEIRQRYDTKMRGFDMVK